MEPQPLPTGSCRSSLRKTSTAALIGTALFLIGCNISPQPEPPPVEEPKLTLRLDLLTLEYLPEPPPLPGFTTISGFAGAVDAEGDTGEINDGVVHVVNINPTEPQGEPPAEVVLAPDGSFSAQLPGALTDHYRIQARAVGSLAGLLYSAPLDVSGTTSPGPAINRPPPFGDCLFFEPSQEIVFEPTSILSVSVETIEITNECPVNLGLMNVQTRNFEPETSFEPIVSMPPMPIPIGATRTIAVGFTPFFAGLHEDLLMMDLEADPPGAPPTGPRVMTLRGVALE